MSQLRTPLGLAALVVTAAASVFLYRTISASTTEPTRDLAVTCGPDHRAIVRQSAGQPTVAVDCVPAAPGLASSGLSHADLAALVAAEQASTRLMPAVYAPEPRIVRTVAPVGAVRTASAPSRVSGARRLERKPSWQKRALVIGGSAGAGAGVGALIGGKKGALIGAAVGGGGATVVDLLKNR